VRAGVGKDNSRGRNYPAASEKGWPAGPTPCLSGEAPLAILSWVLELIKNDKLSRLGFQKTKKNVMLTTGSIFTTSLNGSEKAVEMLPVVSMTFYQKPKPVHLSFLIPKLPYCITSTQPL